MIPREQYPYIGIGLLAALMVAHWAWCCYIAFPMAFERQLKRGKPWVYIPIRWKGGYKLQIALVTRILLLCGTALATALAIHYSQRNGATWLIGFGLAAGFGMLRLNALWLSIRYSQQEDGYYFLHDELRTRLESEGKDMPESAFKSLAIYQHHTLLRKADEKGELIKALRTQARMSRKYRKDVRTREPVET
jgi:predicted outer membrane lipoprotein